MTDDLESALPLSSHQACQQQLQPQPQPPSWLLSKTEITNVMASGRPIKPIIRTPDVSRNLGWNMMRIEIVFRLVLFALVHHLPSFL
jgi:hypothetical protein